MKIELEVDIPEGYEATGEYRVPCGGEFFLWNGPGGFTAIKRQPGDSDICRIILRKKEPLAIQACRAWIKVYEHSRTVTESKLDAYALTVKAVEDFEHTGGGK